MTTKTQSATDSVQPSSFLTKEKTPALYDRLKESLKDFSILDYHYLVKGDISGIQDFIFSVKSEKASKSLKGRSFFVQALSKLGIHLLQKELGENNTKVFYDGGGNFYLLSKVPVAEAVEKARETVDKDCKEREIYLSLSHMFIGQLAFSDVWREINRLSNKEKLCKFSSDVLSFLPYAGPEMEEDKDGDKFEQGARYDKLPEEGLKNFNRKFGFDTATKPCVDGWSIAFFGAKMDLKASEETMQDWVDGLPRWSDPLLKHYEDLVKSRKEEVARNSKVKAPEGNLIEFTDLAHFAHSRTGTEKLAVLKMDVDNLGKLFGGLQDWEGAKKASAAMSWFFGDFMSSLLQKSFGYKDEDGNSKTSKFSDNIYVVFSGGDDTFMVGAWDAVFEFAYCLHQNFLAFASELQTLKINGLPKAEKITLSAALVVVDPKFPVVRFAERAEEALDEAKRFENQKGEKKNSISVFGQVLTWDEFEKGREISQHLAKMIQVDNTSRSIIERIKRHAYDYERLAERAADQNNIPGPKIHRLFYNLRKLTPEPGKEENTKTQNERFMEQLVQDFSAGLLLSFIQRKKIEYPRFPVAARWAEFLTRK